MRKEKQMRKILLAAIAVIGLAASASAQFCPGCLQNTTAVQNATFNITSATIRGPLYAGSITLSSFTATSSVTAANFVGSGTYITNLNASQLLLGTIPPARVAGSYTGVTGLGTITAGVWNASVLTSVYGGTGANLGTANTGAIPYFSSLGTMSALAPTTTGFLLQTNGSGAPSYTGAPSVLGTNVTAIPLANIIPGNIPMSWALNDASISSVSASKVIGSIPGNAANINGTLALSQLAAGTLSTSIAASSITPTGVVAGIWGGPAKLLQLTIGGDGRITSALASTYTVVASSIGAGTLPSNVLVPAANIVAGSLGSSVIASSVSLTGVLPGTYGYAAQVSSFTVGVDGRLSLAGNIPIALPLSQLNAGTLASNVLVPAASVQNGMLGSGVIASSIALNGVVAGNYGGSGSLMAVTVGGNGLITSATTYVIPSLSTSAAFVNITNTWASTQTFKQNIGVAGSVTATTFAGDGSNVTALTAANISSGHLGSSVVASSVAVASVGAPQIVPASIVSTSIANGTIVNGNLASGSYGAVTTLPSLSLVSSVVTHTSSVTVTGPLGILATSSVTAGAFFGDGSHLTRMATNKFGFLSATTQALGAGTFSFGYTNAAVTISSMSVIVTRSEEHTSELQ